jgi:hypothetical protein
MNDSEVREQQDRLLVQADEECRTAEYLNDRFFAVQSKHNPIARNVVQIDPVSGYAVACSGVDEGTSECVGWSVKGWCVHSLLAQRRWAELAPSRHTCDSTLDKRLEASLAYFSANVVSNPGEWPTPDAEREQHVAEVVAKFTDKPASDPFARFDSPCDDTYDRAKAERRAREATERALAAIDVDESVKDAVRCNEARKAEEAKRDAALVHNDHPTPLRRGGVRH